MPMVTTGNTNAPTIMIGDRVADFVTGTVLPSPAAGERRRRPLHSGCRPGPGYAELIGTVPELSRFGTSVR